MTQEEIIEGNKLIDAFMGVKRISSFGKNNNDFSYIQAIKYHTSWDWLMPVIEVISKLKFSGESEQYTDTHYPRTFGMLNEFGLPMFRFNCASLFCAKTLIDAAWMATVDFIKWYLNEINKEGI